MEVKKVILVDNTRLQLRNIKIFEYEPSKPNQLIIGTNGSGKSSVLNELSPLPGDHNDYLPTGSKTIWIDHKGVSYKLISTFSPRSHHFWNLDTNTDLNEGGTPTVQMQLVKQIFGYDKPIHELIQGRRPFHLMEANERKNLFTFMADSDFDYALAVYKRINGKLNDVTGALNTNKKRLVVETSKIMAPEAQALLKKDVDELHAAITELLDNREPVKYSMHDLEDKKRQFEKEIRSVSALMITLLFKIKRDSHISTLTFSLEDTKASIKAFDMMATQFYQEHEEVSKIFETLEKTHTQNIAAIETEISALEAQVADIASRIRLPFSFDDPAFILNSLGTLKDLIIPIVTAIPSNEEKQYSRASLHEATAKLEEKETLKRQLLGKVERNKGMLDHFASLKNNDSTTCPNCQHTWIKNYDAEKVRHLELVNTELTEVKLPVLDKEINEYKVLIEQIHQYFQFYRDYVRVVTSWTTFKPLWDYIDQNHFLFNKPKYIEQVLLDLEGDCQVLKQNVQIQKEITDKLSLVRLTNDTAGMDYDSCKNRKLALEEKIFDNQQKLAVSKREQGEIESQIANLTNLQNMVFSLEKLLRGHKETGMVTIETMRRLAYHDFVKHLQSILARKETALHEVKSQLLVIEDIQEQILNLQFEETNLKRILQELSPKEGLIAEGLFGFIKNYVHQMNRVIKKIWTYPLQVLPCAIGDDNQLDLNYKFPMLVDGKGKPRKDVKEGSSAMHEVVNLSFRITAMKSLGLTDYPLFLDEFGSSMDPTHKAATIHLINTLMSDESFPQLFMISHDAMQYGSLIHTQICVLCDANVSVPANSNYNEHVRIT